MPGAVSVEETNRYREVVVDMPKLEGQSEALRPVLTYINVRTLKEELDLGFFLLRCGQVETTEDLRTRLHRINVVLAQHY